MATSPTPLDQPSGDIAPVPARPRKRGVFKKLVIFLVLVIALGAAGAGGWWWHSQRAGAAAGADGHAAPAPAHHADQGILPLPPFTVNLADSEAARYLRADLRLVIDDAAAVKEVEEDAVKVARLRSAILEILSQKTADVLATPDGKQALKTEIAAAATEILGTPQVSDVLFTEFVVQF